MASRVKRDNELYRWEDPDDPNKDALLAAVRSGTKEDVEKVLGYDSQPTLFYQQSLDCALELACTNENKSVSVIETLLHSGARAKESLKLVLKSIAPETKVSCEVMEILKLLLDNTTSGTEGTNLDTCREGAYPYFASLSVEEGNFDDLRADKSIHDYAVTFAASLGRCDLIYLLMSFKTDEKLQLPFSGALFISILHGFTDCIRALIQHGGKINAPTAFVAAAKGSTLETLKQFPELYQEELQNDESVNKILLDAAELERADMLEFLLHLRPDSIRISIPEYNEKLFVSVKNAKVLQLLIDNGVCVHDSPEFCDFLLTNVRKGKSDIVKICLDSGLDVNSTTFKTEFQTTLLIEAETVEMTQLLLDKGAQVNEVITIEREGRIINTKNALLKAVEKDNEVSGAELPDFENDSAFMIQCQIREERNIKVEMLLEAGGDVNRKNEQGETALHLAIKLFEPISIVKLLLKNGVDVNAISNKNCTAISLFFELMYGLPSKLIVLEELLNYGAKTSTVTGEALQDLIYAGGSWLVPKMIRNGCVLQEYDGKSPLSFALDNGYHKVVEYFLNSKFLTKSDILRIHSQSTFSLPDGEDVLTNFTPLPLSLETLSFVEVSSALGSGPGREERVRTTGLPKVMQRALLFQTETENDLWDSDKERERVLAHENGDLYLDDFSGYV